MDATLTKFVAILVMCEMINCATGIPIKDIPYVLANLKDKRSPPDNFSLFGFGIKTPFSVPIPVTGVRENYNNFKNLFQPTPAQSQNGDINWKQNLNTPQSHNEINIKNLIVNKPDLVPTLYKGDVIGNCEPVLTPSIDNNKIPDVIHGNINGNKNIQVVELNDNAKNDTKSIPKADVNSTQKEKTIVDIATSTETTTKIIVTIENKNNDLVTKIDKKLLDYIFNTIDETTTDTTETGDYTTEAGDYNSTTLGDTDDLLRIPAPVVASLLG